MKPSNSKVNALKSNPRPVAWREIDWQQVRRNVRGIQIRIAKATAQRRWRDVRNLQRLLIRSYSARRLAVREVTEKKGKRTPGVDGELWSTPKAKVEAIEKLKVKGYRPRPLKRVYIPKSGGKGRRPLGIACMLDRAKQTIYKMALEPVAETRADPNSYGFRRGRSVNDAIAQSRKCLAKKANAPYILLADIQSCFDTISHDWILKHVRLPIRILKPWLKAGYWEKQTWHPTNAGVAQGSPLSACVTNWVLDGLEIKLLQRFPKNWRNKNQPNPKVNLVRWADDWICTGATPQLLRQEVRPVVEAFLKERGLRLSEKKTSIVHIRQGFEFLGRRFKKEAKGQLLVKPSKANQKELRRKVKIKLKKLCSEKQETVISQLAPIIRGWGNAFRHDNSKETFGEQDYLIWEQLWQWACKRHPRKGKLWIVKRYFHPIANRNWIFGCNMQKATGPRWVQVPLLSSIQVQRHCKIQKQANPFDPQWETYFENRWQIMAKEKGKHLTSALWRKQGGRCSYCHTPFGIDDETCIHHIRPKCLGGNDTQANLALLHPTCHQQLHARAMTGLSYPDSLMNA